MQPKEKETLQNEIIRNSLTKNLSYGSEKSRANSKIELLEDEEESIPYPKSVFFIVINEFCERFSYYGMKAVLTIYLKNVLEFEENPATVIYHVFSMFCYFTCIFGAMIADSFLGKFRTIFYLSVVYAAGNVLLSLAATKDVGLPQTPFSMFGLALIAIGTGGIKPCVAAFGGDQFILPQQERQLTTFFSVFYFSINAGSLISTFITPIFRKDVHCFGEETCYPLAFSVPAVLMITALVIFLCGKPFYRISPPEGNVVMRVSNCIIHALKNKGSGEKKEHWLDYAEDSYPRQLIEDIKVVLRVLVLYLPLPIFWALFDQQGSRWTFQATRMDGEIFGWTIKPDQMQVVNPFLILALIPIFDQGVYPLLGKMHLLKKPLQRLTMGGLLAAVAFIVSGILELKLEPTYAIELKTGETNLNFVNSLPCNITLTLPGIKENEIIPQYENLIFSQIEAKTYNVKIAPDTTNPQCSNIKEYSYALEAESEKAFTYLIGLEGEASNNKKIKVFKPKVDDDLSKSKNDGSPKIRLIHSGLTETSQWGEGSNATVFLYSVNLKDEKKYNFSINTNDTKPIDLEAATYDVKLVSTLGNAEEYLGQFKFRLGGVYALTLTKNFSNENVNSNSSYVVSSHIITQPNSIHMLWLLPQYFIITVAEVMFSITGLEFSYNQAPSSMKSLIQSAWLLTVAFGNLVVVIVAEAHIFKEQSKEFFLFAGLMIIDMKIFAVMAYFYKPANTNNNTKDENEMTEKQENSGYGNKGYHDE